MFPKHHIFSKINIWSTLSQHDCVDQWSKWTHTWNSVKMRFFKYSNVQHRKHRVIGKKITEKRLHHSLHIPNIIPWWVRIKSPMWQNLKNFQKFLSYDHNSISFGKRKARAFFWMFSHWFWTIFHHFTTFWKKSLFWIYDSLAIWVK